LWNAQGCIDKQLQWFMSGSWYKEITNLRKHILG
jgi:hypothetical protein